MVFTYLQYWNLTGEIKPTKKPRITERENNKLIWLLKKGLIKNGKHE